VRGRLDPLAVAVEAAIRPLDYERAVVVDEKVQANKQGLRSWLATQNVGRRRLCLPAKPTQARLQARPILLIVYHEARNYFVPSRTCDALSPSGRAVHVPNYTERRIGYRWSEPSALSLVPLALSQGINPFDGAYCFRCPATSTMTPPTRATTPMIGGSGIV